MSEVSGFPGILPGFTWRDIDADGTRIRTATDPTRNTVGVTASASSLKV